MSVVYKARDEKLRRTVALKVLPPGFAGDEDRRARFLREARAAAAVTHSNIATIYEIGEEGGRIFIAMELIAGQTLRQIIAHGALTAADWLHFARGIARGLAKAHERGIVHRDLKPDNVMVNDEGEVKILDFGLAKVREPDEATAATISEQDAANLTREGLVVGTPGYMSPEQATGKPVDARSDVFSLGVMLYEMATGVPPFTGGSTVEVIIASSRDRHAPASSVNASLVPAL